MNAVVPVDDIARGTTSAAWTLHRAMADAYRDQDETSVIHAGSRTTIAELYRYNDPGHPEHGTWSFQLIDRRWQTPLAEHGPEWLAHPDGLRPFATWRECFDRAFAAVCYLRGAA